MSDLDPLHLRAALTESRMPILPGPGSAASGGMPHPEADCFANVLNDQMASPQRPAAQPHRAPRDLPAQPERPAHPARPAGETSGKGRVRHPAQSRAEDASPATPQTPASAQSPNPGPAQMGQPPVRNDGATKPVQGQSHTASGPAGAPQPGTPAAPSGNPALTAGATPPEASPNDPASAPAQPSVAALMRQGFRSLLPQGGMDIRKGYAAAAPSAIGQPVPGAGDAPATALAETTTAGGTDSGEDRPDQAPQQDPDPQAMIAAGPAADHPTEALAETPSSGAGAAMIPLRMDQPDWTEKLSARLATAVLHGQGVMEMQMSPEKLGPLHIRLDLAGGEAKVSIETATAQAAALFSDARQGLESALAKSGIALVSHETAAHVRPQNPETAPQPQAGSLGSHAFASGGQPNGQEGGQARGQALAAAFRPTPGDGGHLATPPAAALLRPVSELLNLIA